MGAQERSRREFLFDTLAGVSGAWLAMNAVAIEEASAYVQEAARSGQPRTLAFFTPGQAADVEAMAAQIIPTDSTAGAREARVIDFIDRVLVTFEKSRQTDYTQGLRELDLQTKQAFPSAQSFAALQGPQQIQVLTAMEKAPFFNLVRTHTITGFFASPVHGGNAGKVGWKLVNYDDSLNHRPPFGYYDALPGTSR